MTKISGLLFFILLLTGAGTVCAQVANVTGKVINTENSTPATGVNITLLQNGQVIYRTVTDSAGNFKVPANLYAQMNVMKISGINYQDLIINKKISPDILAGNGFRLGAFAVKPGKIELKEVKVQAKRRYSDTTNIDLSKNKYERAIMMDDLFSGSYGFTKDKNGRLYYKGILVTNVQVDGGDFFGKNNLDIYRLLPALTMENIQVVETNIDSTTNTTRLRPVVKVNLKLKAQYNKGKFGNANAGGGTAGRYLLNTDLFGYRNKQQISVDVNLNNIQAGDNLLVPPSVSFSATGNTLNARGAKFTYHNIFDRKVEVNFDAKGKYYNKLYSSVSDRNDFDIKQVSSTRNTSSLKSYGLDNENFSVNYRIDPLNSINFSQSAATVNSRQNDSLNYNITADNINTVSKVSRLTNSLVSNLSGKTMYLRRFASKKGRLMSINAIYNENRFHITERDNVYSLNNQVAGSYFVDGQRRVINRQFILNSTFTEPLSEDSYISVFVNYKKDDVTETDNVKSDTVIKSYLIPAAIYNQYLEAGLKFQRTFKKFAFDGNVNTIYNLKSYGGNEAGAGDNLKLNFDLKTDYKIDARKNFLASYTLSTTYPDIRQLTSLNSNFDLVSQVTGNASLKPQDKYSLKTSYDLKASDSESLLFDGEFNYYTSKFGYRVIKTGTYLSSITTNVGDAKSASLSFSISKTFASQRYISLVSSVSFQQDPSFVGDLREVNSGILFSQSVSTTVPLIKSLITLTPLLSASYSNFNFGTSSNSVITFTYSDRVSLNAFKSQVTLFPLFNYSHNIGSNHSFSMNGEIKRSFLKNLMNVWIQAYDIFNSFKFFNNYVGPTYTQTTSFTNVRRYVFAGVSYKFNNFK